MTTSRWNAVSRQLPKAIILFVGFYTGGAIAHAPTKSHSRWSIEDSIVNVDMSLHEIDAMRLLGTSMSNGDVAWLLSDRKRVDELATRIVSTFAIKGYICTAGLATVTASNDSPWLHAKWNYRCPDFVDVGKLSLTLLDLFERAPSHLHFVHVERGSRTSDAVLSADRRVFSFAEDGVHSVADLFLHGVHHVAVGLDHLLFLIGLLLITGRLRRLTIALAAFTVGHTLSMVQVGLLDLVVDANLVERFIGLSILWAGLTSWESTQNTANAHRRRFAKTMAAAWLFCFWTTSLGSGWRSVGLATATALLFAPDIFASARQDRQVLFCLITLFVGWVHGAAFGSSFSAIDLPDDARLVQLISFNLGVEAAQLAFAALVVVCPIDFEAAFDRERGSLIDVRYRPSALDFVVVMRGSGNVLATAQYAEAGLSNA